MKENISIKNCLNSENVYNVRFSLNKGAIKVTSIPGFSSHLPSFQLEASSEKRSSREALRDSLHTDSEFPVVKKSRRMRFCALTADVGDKVLDGKKLSDSTTLMRSMRVRNRTTLREKERRKRDERKVSELRQLLSGIIKFPEVRGGSEVDSDEERTDWQPLNIDSETNSVFDSESIQEETEDVACFDDLNPDDRKSLFELQKKESFPSSDQKKEIFLPRA